MDEPTAYFRALGGVGPTICLLPVCTRMISLSTSQSSGDGESETGWSGWVQVLPLLTLQALPLAGTAVGNAPGAALTGVYGLPPSFPGAGTARRLG